MKRCWLSTLLLSTALSAQTGIPHMHHASGTFDVKVTPIPAAEGAPNLGRMSIDKQFHGAIEGHSVGEMLGGGDVKGGTAGYVAIENVTATLDGKKGTFQFMHYATMGGGQFHMQIEVVPASGTGELTGLAGKFTILFGPKGEHSYQFDYTLPETK